MSGYNSKERGVRLGSDTSLGLSVSCTRCHQSARIRLDVALRLWGERTHTRDIARDLRCSKCRARAACVRVISDTRPSHAISEDPGGGFLTGPKYPIISPSLSPAAKAIKARDWAQRNRQGLMADEDKIGTIWNDDELDAIVADYFAMLTAELSGQPYVKSHHSAQLMTEIGRTHRSVEFKHQNISAVMEELGLPWIQGYKPKRNYQNAIFDAIDRFLTKTNWLVQPTLAQHRAPLQAATANTDIFVAPPTLEEAVERPPRLERLVRKFDPVERDFRNRSLGKAGEEFVLEVERTRLEREMRQDLARNIRWISNEEGDGAGYDILSFDTDGRERLIEVKTTNGAAKTPFFLSGTEHEVSEQRRDAWRLYRVHLFAQSPRIFTINPPLAQAVHLRAEAWRASFA